MSEFEFLFSVFGLLIGLTLIEIAIKFADAIDAHHRRPIGHSHSTPGLVRPDRCRWLLALRVVITRLAPRSLENCLHRAHCCDDLLPLRINDFSAKRRRMEESRRPLLGPQAPGDWRHFASRERDHGVAVDSRGAGLGRLLVLVLPAALFHSHGGAVVHSLTPRRHHAFRNYDWHSAIFGFRSRPKLAMGARSWNKFERSSFDSSAGST
jgi:hypothetical protein